MPISKKDRIAREHKKADKEGTRAPVKANGLPVKPAAPKSKCEFCKMELVNTNKAQLISHAAKHEDKGWTKEKCWPNDFTA